METLNLIISMVAVAIAGASLWKSWSLQERQNELAKKQLELAGDQIAARGKGDIRFFYDRSGKSERIVVQNSGQSTAYDVTLDVESPEGRASPLVNDFYDVFPVSSLPSGQSVSVLAALTFDTGTSFKCTARWKNEDGTDGGKSGPLTL